jgi:uncharacterized protein YbjT (DUF2867 family)
VILVTAAGGKTGRAVLHALRDRGEPVRAFARSDAVHELRGPAVETVAGDMLDEEALLGAFADIRAVVHIGPMFHPQEEAMGRAVVDAAVKAGVKRFVQFSVAHPQIDFLLNHQTKLRVEDYLVCSALDYTILQPMHYMQNLDPDQIVRDKVFQLPYSLDAALSFVDLADVAEVAARTLLEDGHIHATYALCGTDRLTGREIAKLIAERAGLAIEGQEVSIPAFIEQVAGGGTLHPVTIDGFYRLFTYYGLHGISGNSNVLRWLLGREPTTFAEYLQASMQLDGP